MLSLDANKVEKLFNDVRKQHVLQGRENIRRRQELLFLDWEWGQLSLMAKWRKIRDR